MLVGNRQFPSTNDHHALNDLRANIVVEENTRSITCYEILGLQTKSPFGLSDRAQALFRISSELGWINICIWLDFKFHQATRPLAMLHRKGIREVNDIACIASCQQFQLTKEKPKIFFPWSRNIPDHFTRTIVSLAPVFKAAETTKCYSVVEMKTCSRSCPI